MKSVLEDFEVGITKLLMFLNRTQQEQELIGLLNERKSALSAQEAALLQMQVETSTNTKQYIYSVAIVSLYGLLERLVDGMVSAFVVQLSDFNGDYGKLPAVIRKNHLRFSLELAEALHKDHFRTETTHERIIANLHSCLSGANDYDLNGSAFTLHRGNHTLARINDILANVGMDNPIKKLSLTRSISAFSLSLLQGRKINDLSDQELTTFFYPIDVLVSRRNSVSHGVVQLDDLESVDLLKERCSFIRAYGAGLFELLINAALNYAAEIGLAQNLGKPLIVHNHRIVCFQIQGELAVGDWIYALTKDPMMPVRSSRIIKLEMNREDKQKISAIIPVQLGVEVGFHANDNYDYYSLPSGQL